MVQDKRLPRQVAFAEDTKVIVGGSDHGRVYLFDRKSGEAMGHLLHDDSGLVQTLAVSSSVNNGTHIPTHDEQTMNSTEACYIFTASSDDRANGKICIWRRSKKRLIARSKAQSWIALVRKMIGWIIQTMISLVVFAALFRISVSSVHYYKEPRLTAT